MGWIYIADEKQEAERPIVKLSGTDGNVFALMGECKSAMIRYNKEVDAGYDQTLVFQEMWDKVVDGDYDNALRVMGQYCEVR